MITNYHYNEHFSDCGTVASYCRHFSTGKRETITVIKLANNIKIKTVLDNKARKSITYVIKRMNGLETVTTHTNLTQAIRSL